jgi:hypothetical protein
MLQIRKDEIDMPVAAVVTGVVIILGLCGLAALYLFSGRAELVGGLVAAEACGCTATGKHGGAG